MKNLNKIIAICGGIVLLMCQSVFNGFAAENNLSEKEQSLLAVLKSEAGLKEKADACRQLAVYGSKASVATLASLLTDEKLSHMARYALEPIKDPSVDEAFRAALGKVKGRLLVGVIGSIGVRRDAKSVESLTGFLKDNDTEVAQAAARALGSIGTASAAKALRNYLEKAPQSNVLPVCEGLFRCAELLAANGQTKDAVSIYDFLRDYKQIPHQVKTGAIRGSILTRSEKDGLSLLQQCLKSDDYLIFSAAVKTALEMKNEAAGKILAGELKNLKADSQIVVLNALATRGDKSAVDAVVGLVNSANKSVKLTAVKALGSIGDASALPVLVNLVDEADEEVSLAVRDTLCGFAGKAADSAALKMLTDQKPERRLIGIDIVARRKIPNSAIELMRLASDSDQKVRQLALRRVGELGDVSTVDQLLALANKSNNQQEMNSIAQSLSVICSKAGEQDAVISKVAKFFETASSTQKSALMQVFSAVGTKSALNVVLNAVKNQDRGVRESAVRALGDWKSPEPAADLVSLAKSAQTKEEKALCLRSFFNLARQTEIAVDQRVNLCKEASGLVETAEEKKLLLSTISRATSDQAFDLIVPMLGDDSVANEAGSAVVEIASKLLQSRRATASAKTIDALQKTVSAKINENIVKQAASLLEKAKSSSR